MAARFHHYTYHCGCKELELTALSYHDTVLGSITFWIRLHPLDPPNDVHASLANNLSEYDVLSIKPRSSFT
jgi:hypothetical protein